MLPDEITVEDGVTDIVLNRIVDPSAKPSQVVRRSEDELYVMKTDQTSTGSNRRRHSLNYVQRKPTEEATLAGSVPSAGVTVTFDRPVDGFTVTEITRLWTHASAMVDTYVDDLYAGEG